MLFTALGRLLEGEIGHGNIKPNNKIQHQSSTHNISGLHNSTVNVNLYFCMLIFAPGSACTEVGLNATNQACGEGFYCLTGSDVSQPNGTHGAGGLCPEGYFCPEGTKISTNYQMT